MFLNLREYLNSAVDSAGGSVLSSVANSLLFTRLGREALFVGTMYMAGGAVISVVGVAPVVATGAAVYLLS